MSDSLCYAKYFAEVPGLAGIEDAPFSAEFLFHLCDPNISDYVCVFQLSTKIPKPDTK